MADGAIIQVLLGTVTNLLIAEAALLKGVKEQMKQLEKDLEWMYLELKEANRKCKSDENSRLYAKQMRAIISDAEDVIGSFINKIVNHKRHQKDSKARTGLKFIINIPFRHGLGNRIGEINASIEKLRRMEEHTSSGGSKSSNCDHTSLSIQQQIKERRAEIFKETRCLQEPVQIYENTTRRVLDLLLGDESTVDGKKLRIISITGMGGVGKTTLCQKVFNDGNVVGKFKYRAFVYISEVYSLPDLLKQIMKSCGFIDSEEEVTSEKVRDHLEKHKYLIVLDDIWDTNVWKKLRDAFPDTKNGSRVLLTTRHKYVAVEAGKSSVNANDIHELSALNDETKNWKLFWKNYLSCSSSSDTYEAPDFSSDLVKLGNTMLDKCHGLPLAIVVLGGLLSLQVKEHPVRPVWSVWASENDRSSWLSSRGKNYYKCPGILALSYDCLPYHLKPCFLYTSLFPENSMIPVTKLFQYWIAEGFITKNGEQMLEDTAMDYLDELISRSLIQVGKRRCDGKIKTCHIHGLLHGISASESTEDEFSQAYGSIDKFNRKQDCSRRVSVYCKMQKQKEQYLSKSHNTRIRCLICHEDIRFPTNKYLSSFFGGFKSLRVLEFYGQTGIVSLPKELGELIHLRYLSLEKTKLEMINTSYLCKIVNLQTLNLKGNIGHEIVLDDQIWCLDQLRHLYLRNIQPAANNRRKRGIDNLEELQLLVIQAGEWIHDGELEKLSSLRKLKLEECLHSYSDKISSALANLTNLRSLGLKSKISAGSPITNEGVPLASIKFSSHTYLTSLHFKGSLTSRWTGDISFPPHLCKLKLEWSWIAEDPMLILEKLPLLTFLHLGVASYLGKQMVCSETGFGRLQTLELVSVENLEKWIIKMGAPTNLTKLEILGCNKLKMIPDGLQQLTTLKQLRVANMPQLLGRIAENIGEDWHKIEHIPSRDILA